MDIHLVVRQRQDRLPFRVGLFRESWVWDNLPRNSCAYATRQTRRVVNACIGENVVTSFIASDDTDRFVQARFLLVLVSSAFGSQFIPASTYAN